MGFSSSSISLEFAERVHPIDWSFEVLADRSDSKSGGVGHRNAPPTIPLVEFLEAERYE